MPSVIGCVDGSHVRIVRPMDHERTYVNRKVFHSINVQVILAILYVAMLVILIILI